MFGSDKHCYNAPITEYVSNEAYLERLENSVSNSIIREGLKSLMESYVSTKQYFYHVSPESQFYLEPKGLWVISKAYGIYPMSSLRRIKTIWKLKPKKALNIFNFFNESDVKVLEEKLKTMSSEEITTETKRIYSMNPGMLVRNVEYTKDSNAFIALVRNNFKKMTKNKDENPRWFDEMARLAGVISLAGFDGYAEDGDIFDHLSGATFRVKIALFIFNAKESLEVVEELDRSHLSRTAYKRKTETASDNPYGRHKLSKSIGNEIY